MTATTLSSSFQTSLSQTVLKETDLDTYIAIASDIGEALDGPASAALKSIGDILGRTQSDVTTTQASGSSTAVNVQLEDAGSCTTGDHIGPGGGDKIVYLKNARVVWLDDGKQTYLALLGSSSGSRLSCVSVNALKNGTTVLDATTAQSLLAVDPLTSGGPNMTLPSSRYTLVREIDLDPATTTDPDTDRHSESQWAYLGTTTTTNTVTTDTLKAGLLAFLGVGPSRARRPCSRSRRRTRASREPVPRSPPRPPCGR